MTDKPRSIHAKLADAREQFHQLKLEKTGKNTYAGYSYFELVDFLIPAMKCLKDNGLVTLPVDFGTKFATMNLWETEGDSFISFRSPMIAAHYVLTKDEGASTMTVDQGVNLKGCHPIQNMGAVQTYQRRYLWVSLMEILEHDAVDSAEPEKDKPKPKAVVKKVKAVADRPTNHGGEDPNDGPSELEMEIPSHEDAIKYVDSLIDFATKNHCSTVDDLIGFWKTNSELTDYLNGNFPEAFSKLKDAFTEMKSTIMEKN